MFPSQLSIAILSDSSVEEEDCISDEEESESTATTSKGVSWCDKWEGSLGLLSRAMGFDAAPGFFATYI